MQCGERIDLQPIANVPCSKGWAPPPPPLRPDIFAKFQWYAARRFWAWCLYLQVTPGLAPSGAPFAAGLEVLTSQAHNNVSTAAPISSTTTSPTRMGNRSRRMAISGTSSDCLSIQTLVVPIHITSRTPCELNFCHSGGAVSVAAPFRFLRPARYFSACFARSCFSLPRS